MSRSSQLVRLTIAGVFVLWLQISLSLTLYAQDSEEDSASPVAAPIESSQPPLSFTFNTLPDLLSVGSSLSLESVLANLSAAPLTSLQLDLPRHTAVTYTSGPGIPAEGIAGGTLELGDLEAGQTLAIALTVQVHGRGDSDRIELPFQVRSAATDPVTVTVSLEVEALPDAEEATEAEETAVPPAAVPSEPVRWQMGYTPPGTSAFTGAATYSFPIAVPPGIGGLTPSLVLGYNSRGFESKKDPVASRGFGEGWGMPQAEITNGNATNFFDSNPDGYDICGNFYNSLFTLSLNGVSHNLKARPGVNRYGRYDALGDPTLYIEYKNDGVTNVTGEYWLIRTADGAEYLFGKAEHAEQAIGPLRDSCPQNAPQPRNQGFMALSWKLESITNVYGQQVRYTYGTACSEHFGDGTGCRRFPLTTHVAESYVSPPPPPAQPTNQFRREADVALWRIEYNFSGGIAQSKIQFFYSSQNLPALRHKKWMAVGYWRPSRVVVSQAEQTVAAYTFSYDQRYHYIASDDLSTNNWWLTSINTYGNDYVFGNNPPGTALPAHTFSYEQNTNACGLDFDQNVHCIPILTKVDNGYGGVSRFLYDTYNGNGGLGGDWFVVREMFTWDGVRHVYNGNNNTAASRLHFSRNGSGYTACYDKDNDGCRAPSFEPSLSLVGFSGVTRSAQYYNGSIWTTLAKSQEEFNISTYWLNGKTTAQRALNPTNNAVLSQETFTWTLAGAYGVDPQLTQQDHYIYADDKTLHSFDTFSYLNGASDFGALHEQRQYRKELNGSNTLHRCTQHAYAHQTAGAIWLVNRPLRQTLYAGNCDGTKLAETLYRYDSATTPTDTSLNGKAALAYTLVWRGNTAGDGNYLTTRQTYYGAGANHGLPHQSFTYSNYSTTTAFASTVRNTTTVQGYNALSMPTSIQTSASGVTSQNQSFSYSTPFAWLPAAVSDANNDSTHYRYDLFGRLTKVIRPGDSEGNPTIWYLYWDNLSTGGVLFTKPLLIQTAYKGSNGVRQFYDGLGRLVQEQAPGSNVRYGSNSFGERDILTTYAYDARSLLTCQTAPYDVAPYVWNGLTPYQNHTCANYARTSTEYDTLGRVKRVTAADGTMMAHHHYGVTDANGAAETYHDVIDANRRRTQQNYDAWGRLVRVHEISGDCGSYWAGEGFGCSGAYTEPWATYATTSYYYNRRDQLTKVVDNAGNDTLMSYNAIGHKLSMHDPDMGLWRYTYDEASNLQRQFDARNNALCFYYDNFNRLLTKGQQLNSTVGASCPAAPAPGAANHRASYTYGASAANNNIGRLVSVGDTSGSQSFFYDDRGRLSSQNRLINGNGTTFTLSYGYDALDRVTSMTYPNGETVNTTYNNQGLPQSLSGSNSYVDSAQYNRMGQLKVLDLGNSLKSWYGYLGYEPFTQNDIYDAIWGQYGRLWRICTAPDASNRCQYAHRDTTPIQQRLDLRYSYDNVGNVTGILDQVNSSQQQTFTYDHRNRLTFDSPILDNYSYDELGNIVARSNVDIGMSHEYLYNAVQPHAVTSVATTHYFVGFMGGFIFDYDANGNMTHRTLGIKTFNQQFDAENRLVQVAQSGVHNCGGLVQEAEAGARVGNFIVGMDTNASSSRYVHVPNGVGSRTAPDEGQKVTYCFHVATAGTYRLKGWVYGASAADDSFFVKIDGLPANGYFWDIAENTTYQPDYLNNYGLADPVEVTLAAGNHTIVVYLREDGTRLDKLELELQGAHTGNVTSFTYDAGGQRVKMVEPSGVATYYPFPGYEQEVNGSTTTRRLTYSLGGQAVALRVQVVGGSNTYYFIHSDHLGSTSLLTNNSGVLVTGSTARYHPFGSWRTQPTAGLTDRGFTGHLHNNLAANDLGLIYMNARYYVPGIGRFASADTLVPDPANPQSFNRYSYVYNNPLNHTDPSGHCVDSCSFDSGDTEYFVWLRQLYNNSDWRKYMSGSLGSFDNFVRAYEAYMFYMQNPHIALEHSFADNNTEASQSYAWASNFSSNVLEEFFLPYGDEWLLAGATEARAAWEQGDREAVKVWFGYMGAIILGNLAEESFGSSGLVNHLRFNSDQNALIQLAKEAKRSGGLTVDEAAILRGWSQEYNISFRGPEIHPNRPFGQYPHIHVGPVNHIRVNLKGNIK